jgi:hypothetical protein
MELNVSLELFGLAQSNAVKGVGQSHSSRW